MIQYEAIKAQNPDCLLFFRLGDFYELFGDDAREAARLLNITLTARSSGEGRQVKIPMAGVPYHAAPTYIQRLLKAGKKVAVCEQMEEAAKAKGMVRRELVRIITPGTALEETYLEGGTNNYVAALSTAGREWALAAADLTTGEFHSQAFETGDEASLSAELSRLQPAELLLADNDLKPRTLAESILPKTVISLFRAYAFEPSQGARVLKTHLNWASLEGLGYAEDSAQCGAAGALLLYLKETQKSSLAHLSPPQAHRRADFLTLDASTRRHLEITANLDDGSSRATLFDVLDYTRSSAGGRTLKRWLHAPLLNFEAISARHDALAELAADSALRLEWANWLGECGDMERALGRLGSGAGNPRDLASIRQTLGLWPALKQSLAQRKATLFASAAGLNSFQSLATTLTHALVDAPPLSTRDGGFIRAGFDSRLDEIVADSHGGREKVLAVQERERLRSGKPNLKVQFNHVFGFYIEISKAQAVNLPADYERKQTLVNAERFTTPELKELETRVLKADEKRRELELQIFQDLGQSCLAQATGLLALATYLAELDVLRSLAEAAVQHDYVRPELVEESILEIAQGRHPVIEKLLREQGSSFVGNDLKLDTRQRQILLITGPNMAGKSTFMRQAALIALMAQAGSFVPAKKARIGLVDQIFTRVGASDRLTRGMSTFLVEMTETANILRNATPRSLVVLDEIGRGTSTYDGVSIAWAVAEYLHETPSRACRTLFATHYFELTDLERLYPRVANACVLVREQEGKIIFMHQIHDGSSEHSHGIAVAKLAGVPDDVLERARQVLARLEAHRAPAESANLETHPINEELELFGNNSESNQLAEEIRGLKVDQMTPLQALQTLDQLKSRLSQPKPSQRS